jgi:hypothetical protein
MARPKKKSEDHAENVGYDHNGYWIGFPADYVVEETRIFVDEPISVRESDIVVEPAPVVFEPASDED